MTTNLTTLRLQIALDATPQAVYEALTTSEALGTWFAEHAEVSLEEKHYVFWGRYTPDNPDREQGLHVILEAEANKRLVYSWQVWKSDTTVEFTLHERGEKTLLAVQHKDIVKGFDDFWFLALENLRRYLDKRPVDRFCDFSAPMLGDVHYDIEIAGSAEAVFRALIQPDQMERWIASKATVDAKVGGIYDYGWTGFGPMKIVELEPGQKLAVESPEGSESTIMTWTLEESGGKTRLTLVHSGFASDKDNTGIFMGWLNFMNWIRSIVEYGERWLPPLPQVAEAYLPYYAASIGSRQDELIFDKAEIPAVAAAPKLGTYVEIRTTVPDIDETRAFYEKLGFQRLANDAVTDGSINIRLVNLDAPSPALCYFGAAEGNGALKTLHDPDGVTIQVSAAPSELPMPAGDALKRTPISRCGKFGEFSIGCANLQTSLEFWKAQGFDPLLVEGEPHPWAILVDGLIVVGLHQNPDIKQPTIAYFAADMRERIAQFQKEGYALTLLEFGGDATQNAVMTAPGGQQIFLFTGEI